jgi:hypothetical protein
MLLWILLGYCGWVLGSCLMFALSILRFYRDDIFTLSRRLRADLC